MTGVTLLFFALALHQFDLGLVAGKKLITYL
jgi:hypothetical protein